MKFFLGIAIGIMIALAWVLLSTGARHPAVANPRERKARPYCPACRNTGYISSNYIRGDGAVMRHSIRCLYCGRGL
jgi:hypothetical protein